MTRGGESHAEYGMKMTMPIDEELLDRVIKAYDCSSKTEAVEMALREMDRRARLKEHGEKGLGLSAEELGDAVDPDYDLMAMRVAEPLGKRGYGKKRSG